jgi:hypothetical protein
MLAKEMPVWKTRNQVVVGLNRPKLNYTVIACAPRMFVTPVGARSMSFIEAAAD